MPITVDRMVSLVEGLPTKAAKIRKLAAAGVSRADIAGFLNIRYQHVRNVLVAPAPAQRPLVGASPESGDDRRSRKTRIGPKGRVDVPEALLKELGLGEGDTLFATIADGELHLLPVSAAVRRAQEIVRRFVPEGVSLVDDLLEDRRREVEREIRRG